MKLLAYKTIRSWIFLQILLLSFGSSAIVASYLADSFLPQKLYWSVEEQKELERLDRYWQKIYKALLMENRRRTSLERPLLISNPPILIKAKAAFADAAMRREKAIQTPRKIARIAWAIGVGFLVGSVAIYLISLTKHSPNLPFNEEKFCDT